MRIDSYDFGRVIISGVTYTADVLVFPDRVESSWWRKEGHRLAYEDLSSVLDSRPEVLIVGTGYGGAMMVPDAVVKTLKDQGIETVVAATQKACELFNELSAQKRVVAALHLTC